ATVGRLAAHRTSLLVARWFPRLGPGVRPGAASYRPAASEHPVLLSPTPAKTDHCARHGCSVDVPDGVSGCPVEVWDGVSGCSVGGGAGQRMVRTISAPLRACSPPSTDWKRTVLK